MESAGLNITANNYLKHAQYEAMLKELGQCQTGKDCEAVFAKYQALSDKNNAELLTKIRNGDVQGILEIHREIEKVSNSHIIDLGARQLMTTPGKPELSERFSEFAFKTFEIEAQGILGHQATTVDYFSRHAPQVIQHNRNHDPVAVARNQQAIKQAASFLIDFIPVIGDIKGFAEAETKGDYFFAALGVLGPLGDAAQKINKAKKAYEAAKMAQDVGKMKEAMQVAHKGADLPYDSKGIRETLEQRYGVGNVTSTTVPPDTAKNTKLAGQKHPKTGIVFDKKGFPIFDDIAKYDTRIDLAKFRATDYKGQMKLATEDLAKSIASEKINKGQFTPQQLDAIQKGSGKIPGYT